MITFLVFAQNIDSGYMLEPSHSSGSNEYTRYNKLYVLEQKKKENNVYIPL